jgi:putative aldouronate transport system substrate-binding protein
MRASFASRLATIEDRMKLVSAAALAVLALASPIRAQEATELRIVQKPLELTIHMHFRDKYTWKEDWPVAREVARLTGIKLKGVASKATANSREAFNLMIASGGLADIVAGNDLRHDFVRYGMEGAFAPLNRLIDEHAPHLKKFLADNPEIRRAISAPDGNIYWVPYVPDGKFARGWFIRHDWLDKLGLQPPRTVDELYLALKAFRDRDPNGNGQKDEVPLFFREPFSELQRLLTFWDARSSGSDAAHDFYVDNGKIRHPYADDNYRAGIRNIARWYAEGLIDKEVFTRGSRAREQLLGNNVGGMTHDWFASTASYNTSLGEKVPGMRFHAVEPPASASERRVAENRRARLRPDGWAITTANKQPVATIKLFDFYFSPVGRRLSNFGVAGVHYDLVDGKPRFKPEILNAKAPVNAQMWEAGAQIPIGFWQDYEYERQWTDEIALKGIELYEKGDFLIDEFLGVSMTVDERRVFDRQWPNIQTYMVEMQQAWILGARNVDADWAAYKTQLTKRGFDQVLAVMQKAYDRQYR